MFYKLISIPSSSQCVTKIDGIGHETIKYYDTRASILKNHGVIYMITQHDGAFVEITQIKKIKYQITKMHQI